MTATATIMIISGFRACSRRSFHCRLFLSPYYSRPLHTSYPSHSQLPRYPEMVEMTRRRIHGNGNGDSADKAKSPTGAVGERGEHHDQPHIQSHSHGIFGGHSHSHSHGHGHGHDGHDHGGGLIETLQSGGAAPGPIQHFLCVFTMALAHTSLSSSVLASPFVKVTEEVASHLLDWSRMFS
jgi:hypothetical protein